MSWLLIGLVVALCGAIGGAFKLWRDLREMTNIADWESTSHYRTSQQLEQAKALIEGLDASLSFERMKRQQLEFEFQKVNTAVHRIGWDKAWN